MLNGIFVVLIVGSVLLAALTGRMEPLTRASVDSAKEAVTLALGLVGVMAFWLGLMKVAEEGGLLRILARALGPAFRRLFPSVPPKHPAMSAMILNIASNLLGLGNAATPFGIKAMTELDRLNGDRGTATDAMVLFLAINTAGLAIVPTGILALRAAAGSADAAGILAGTWLAGGCATIVGVAAAVFLARLPRYRTSSPPGVANPEREQDPSGGDGSAPAGSVSARVRRFRTAWAVLLGGVFAAAAVLHGVRSAGTTAPAALARELLSYWILPLLIGGIVLFGWVHGVRVYSALVDGAKEGFEIAVRIIPYLVAILVAAGMCRASGGLELLERLVGRWTSVAGVPAEVLPLAALRPLSGSGSYAILADLLRTHGPDSFVGYMASTIQGSTETTFYVLAVYFGAVGVRRTRHALPACLLADAAGISAAIGAAHLLFG